MNFSSENPPDHFICQISHSLMNQPVMCPKCSKNFEAEVLMVWLEVKSNKCESVKNNIRKGCPTCKQRSCDFTLNRALRDLIQAYRMSQLKIGPQAGGGRSISGQELMSSDNPYCAVFIGLSGAGKSKTINSIAGRNVCVSKQSGSGVTHIPSVAFNEKIFDKDIMLIDAPGLFDPDKKNDEILIQLTEMLKQKVDGLDAIVHVIKMGRLSDSEIQMPLIILNSLASSEKEQSDIINRYKIVVTNCDSSDDTDSNPSDTIAEFRGRLRQVFPKELDSAIKNAIFVEHNQRLKSDYNDLSKFRERFVSELVSCRKLKATCFKPKLLTDTINETREDIERILREDFSIQRLEQITYENLVGLQNFFHFVLSEKKWQPIRSNDKLPDAFIQRWNSLPTVRRDGIATDTAKKMHTKLEDASRRVLERKERELEARHQREISRIRDEIGTRDVRQPEPKRNRCSIM